MGIRARAASSCLILAQGLGAGMGCVPDATLRQVAGDAGAAEAGPAQGSVDGASWDAIPVDDPSQETPPLADAGSTDGTNDGASVDSGAEPGACQAVQCHAGQSCDHGYCAFPCAGVRVPDDYATVQAAVEAVAPTGGTICVGAGDFHEYVQITTDETLSIQGLSADRSTIDVLDIQDSRDVTLRGLTIAVLHAQSLTSPGMHGLSVVASTLGDVANAGNALTVVPLAGDLAVLLDGVDLSSHGVSAGTGGAIEIEKVLGGAPALLSLEVRNSYLHDSEMGVDYASSGTTASMALMFNNDTFASNGTAINIATTDPINLQYYNDLIVNNDFAVDLSAPPAGAGNNAFFGNTGSNYAGDAGGTGDVLSDPMLDRARPPGLLLNSPCRGAADPSRAPATDFWGRARGASPDIGAVQSSP
jgi:hypothetical protein